MMIFKHCRKVVTDPFGLEKVSELARHRTTGHLHARWPCRISGAGAVREPQRADKRAYASFRRHSVE